MPCSRPVLPHVWVFASLLVVSITEARRPPQLAAFERFDACVLTPDQRTDGDSFRVQLPDGRLETFRLYFVDTLETQLSGKRSRKQAHYFNLDRESAVALGHEAKAFTARALAEPFTVYTRWHALSGGTRYYAFVQTADGKDLAELLVRHGLARVRGRRSTTPYGRSRRIQFSRLRELERLAQAEQVGGWAAQRD